MLKLMGVFCVVSVKLCKEYLAMATLKLSILLLQRGEHFDILTAFLRHHIQELHFLKKMYGFYWATLYTAWWQTHTGVNNLSTLLHSMYINVSVL